MGRNWITKVPGTESEKASSRVAEKHLKNPTQQTVERHHEGFCEESCGLQSYDPLSVDKQFEKSIQEANRVRKALGGHPLTRSEVRIARRNFEKNSEFGPENDNPHPNKPLHS